jgi:hypothetical protein
VITPDGQQDRQFAGVLAEDGSLGLTREQLSAIGFSF